MLRAAIVWSAGLMSDDVVIERPNRDKASSKAAKAVIILLLLASVGLYGVIAYSVARRTREIGIRMALGANPVQVVRMVMRQGLVVAAAGLVCGCALAVAAARAIAGALYGVTPADPLSWLTAAALLFSVSALANFVPAWRASRVDPTKALRIE